MSNKLRIASACLALLLVLPALAAEGRTPIWLPGTSITADGRYVVTRNLTGGSGVPLIDIRADRVDLDLNGFTLDGAGSDTGIVISGLQPAEIVIRDGLIVGCPRAIERPAGLPVASTVVIEDMQIRDAPNTAIYLYDVENPVVRRVNLTNSADAAGNGIEIDGPAVFKSGTIEHNTIRAFFHAIRVVRASAFAIRHNRIETPFGHGITVDRCVGCLIEKNTISDADNDGIILWAQSNGCKIYNNVVHRGEIHGIHIGEDCFDNLVLDNVIRESGWGGAPQPGFGGGHGMFVEGHRNHIERNTVNYNDACGIFLIGADNTFGRNMARGNDPGGIGWCAPCGGLSPPDFCDNGPGNMSFGDNLTPAPLW